MNTHLLLLIVGVISSCYAGNKNWVKPELVSIFSDTENPLTKVFKVCDTENVFMGMYLNIFAKVNKYTPRCTSLDIKKDNAYVVGGGVIINTTLQDCPFPVSTVAEEVYDDSILNVIFSTVNPITDKDKTNFITKDESKNIPKKCKVFVSMKCKQDEHFSEESFDEHEYDDDYEEAVPINVDNEILATFNRNKAPIKVNDILTLDIDKSCVQEVVSRLRINDLCESVKRYPESSYVQEVSYPESSKFEDFEKNTPGYPTLC
ncbi:C-C chemokine binding protein [Cotia virus SPAn232]|uniref:C-C chemokine binding protein n=2 Tax=Cotia virus TaxID=39444 RepID=H6TAG4_9POXV|nr:C-C chemokine binding protein [Cotia virus SPAn232]YP_005296363.1 C-C chemokine binding protein [Cotia virus SPAn232]AIT70626.1 C-C chemokine binding protein [Cotia virus]AFB76901.1 C-C chemokine binding protein [Cotia virus SPAn232]AFB76977.1 C-C chemokine binding protein [Cotia virus SPAn232]AIT70790.1 C-C chemokine binding protein [Cotia virus]